MPASVYAASTSIPATVSPTQTQRLQVLQPKSQQQMSPNKSIPGVTQPLQSGEITLTPGTKAEDVFRIIRVIEMGESGAGSGTSIRFTLCAEENCFNACNLENGTIDLSYNHNCEINNVAIDAASVNQLWTTTQNILTRMLDNLNFVLNNATADSTLRLQTNGECGQVNCYGCSWGGYEFNSFNPSYQYYMRIYWGFKIENSPYNIGSLTLKEVNNRGYQGKVTVHIFPGSFMPQISQVILGRLCNEGRIWQ